MKQRTRELLSTLAQKYELEDSKREEFIRYLLPFFRIAVLMMFLQKIFKFLLRLSPLTGVVLGLIWFLVPEFFSFNLSRLNEEEKLILVGIALSYSLSSFGLLYSFLVFEKPFGFSSCVPFEQDLEILEKNLQPVIEEFINESS